jgi:hypothetical protein
MKGRRLQYCVSKWMEYPATMTGLKIYLKIPYNQLHIKNWFPQFFYCFYFIIKLIRMIKKYWNWKKKWNKYQINKLKFAIIRYRYFLLLNFINAGKIEIKYYLIGLRMFTILWDEFFVLSLVSFKTRINCRFAKFSDKIIPFCLDQ